MHYSLNSLWLLYRTIEDCSWSHQGDTRSLDYGSFLFLCAHRVRRMMGECMHGVVQFRRLERKRPSIYEKCPSSTLVPGRQGVVCSLASQKPAGSPRALLFGQAGT